MKILLDVMGADSPENIIDGACFAECPGVTLELVGDETLINNRLNNVKTQNSIVVTGTTEVVSNNEAPVSAIRTKKDSSVRRVFELLRSSDEYIGAISSGSTGAVLAAGTIILGRIPGIDRPTLVPLMPSITGGFVAVADAGANVDCLPDWLYKFALMSDAYVRFSVQKDNPRVGLLNVGTEEHKGNNLTKETYELLRNSKLNFIGNIEARNAFDGSCDIIISDGFCGNILVKSAEGTAGMLVGLLKKEIKSSKKAMFGSLFMKNVFKSLKVSMDYNSFGGAPLLGVKKPVVKTHGSSKPTAIVAAIKQIISMHESGIIARIEERISDSSENL